MIYMNLHVFTVRLSNLDNPSFSSLCLVALRKNNTVFWVWGPMGTTTYVLFGNKADSGIMETVFQLSSEFGDLLAVVPCFVSWTEDGCFWRSGSAHIFLNVEESYGVVDLQQNYFKRLLYSGCDMFEEARPPLMMQMLTLDFKNKASKPAECLNIRKYQLFGGWTWHI